MHSFITQGNKTWWIKLQFHNTTAKHPYPTQLLFSCFCVYFQQFQLGPCARGEAGSKQHVPAGAMRVCAEPSPESAGWEAVGTHVGLHSLTVESEGI